MQRFSTSWKKWPMASEVYSNTPLFRELAGQLLQQGTRIRFRASGRSMYPAIHDGDVVEIEPVSGKALCRGDIVLVVCPTGLKVHRIIKLDDGEVVTCGDASLDSELPMGLDHVLGRVCNIEGKRSDSSQPVRSWLRTHRSYRRFRTLLALWMTGYSVGKRTLSR
jgi:hypothetical protein